MVLVAERRARLKDLLARDEDDLSSEEQEELDNLLHLYLHKEA